MRKLSNSRGDTIIEVLVALTILTAVLVGAYATASRARSASQAAQERGEATKIAETQVERIKSLLARDTPPTLPTSAAFCVKDDNTVKEFSSFSPAPPNPFSEPLETATLPYPGECGNLNNLYNVAVSKDADNTFNFLVRWRRIGGGMDQINMYYRVY